MWFGYVILEQASTCEMRLKYVSLKQNTKVEKGGKGIVS